jgi:membrane protein
MARRIWNVVEQTFTRFFNNDGMTLAAATAYYAAFSFFPLISMLISGLGLVLQYSESAQDAKHQLLDVLAERTAPGFAAEVHKLLADVQLRSPYNLWVAFILLFGAIGIFSQIEFAFDSLWHDPGSREHGIAAAVKNALWNRLKAFLTLVALGIVVIVAFIADLTLAAVRTWTEALPAGTSLWDVIQIGSSIGLNTVVLALVYRLIPRRKVRWLHAAFGGLVVAVVWQFGNQLLSRFIVGGNYSAYGVVGSFIAFMLWVYCASILLYLGAQLVQALGAPFEPPSLPAQPEANSSADRR